MSWGAVVAGAVFGILSAFGIGGGSLLMIWMTAVLNMEQQTAQAINLLYLLPAASISLIFHIHNRQICWRAAVPAILAGVVTAALSAWAASCLEAVLLRKAFGVFLLVIGVLELRKKPSPPPKRQVPLQNQ